jgi:hypothetical protein
MDLAAAVAPTTLARQRTLPVADPLIPLLPDGALSRGRAVSCGGIAATSLAVALAAEATIAGAWLAVVDVPWLGVEAVAELGVPLERLVRVDMGCVSEPRSASERSAQGGSWADLVAAVLDGFEVVITRVPKRLNAGVIRRVQARVQAREAVLIAVGEPGPLVADITMEASTPVWVGVEHGSGRLRGRRVTVSATGRRVPRPRRAELWLPGPDGAVAPAAEVTEPVLLDVSLAAG